MMILYDGHLKFRGSSQPSGFRGLRARRNAELQQLWELMNSSEHDALCSMLASQKRDLDEAEWELQQTLEEVMLNCKQRKVYM